MRREVRDNARRGTVRWKVSDKGVKKEINEVVALFK